MSLAYSLITLWNVGVMLALVRWRGITSFEGLGMLLLALIVASDWVALVIALLLAPGSAEVAARVVARVWPGVVHLIGLGAFAAGLAIASPAAPPVQRRLSSLDKRTLRHAGLFVLAQGLIMKAMALGSEGITSIGSYFANAYAYNASQRQLGSFWDWGGEIALFGAALVAASHEPARKRQMAWLAFLLLMAFLLTSTRAGIAFGCLIFFVVVATLNPTTVRSWVRPGTLAALTALLIVTAGIKSQLRFFPGTWIAVKTDWRTLATVALSTIGTRFGDAGVYAGYVNLVNRQSEDPSRLMHGRVLTYTLTAWVPHIVYPSKPIHPFRDIGDLIRSNYTSRYDTVYAPTLVGYAFVDFGLASVVLYLFLGGFTLGVLRRLMAAPGVPIVLLVAYLHVMLIQGATNFIHNGFLTSAVGLMLASATVSLAAAGVTAVRLVRGLRPQPVWAGAPSPAAPPGAARSVSG